MNFSGALAAIKSGAQNSDRFDDLARLALAEGEEEAALRFLHPAAEHSDEALLWQWTGLLYRSLDEHERAIQAFQRASAIAPKDGSIAHGHARVALEAGLDAVELFLRARSLAPGDGDVALGLASARNAAGDGEYAAEELRNLLHKAPAWIAGHEQFAQLRSLLGQKSHATETLELAISQFPAEESLWLCLFGIDIRREDYPSLARNIERAALATKITTDTLSFYRAIVAAELGEELFPEALFKVPSQLEPNLAIWQIRHLLSRGAVDEALPIINKELASPRAFSTWPYASTAWRLAGDDRLKWLEGYPQIVEAFDLTADLPDLGELAKALRDLHVAKGEYVDQSVRGGTQTDGPLLSRIDPLIRKTRAAIVGAVETYVARLPEIDLAHPLLAPRRDRRTRFSGSWSVRLKGGGRHSNHVHPQGWISSALYISLPPKEPGGASEAGWLTIGEPPQDLGIKLPPWRKVEPAPGRLVLFPSWMWHGTIPFAQGERLTIAFDVRPPI